MIEGVAETAAQRGDIVDLVGDGGAPRVCSGKDHAVRVRLKIRERNVRFGAEKQPRRKNIIVPALHAAIEAAERIADNSGIGIGQRAGSPAQTVSDVAADIEAAPIIGGGRTRRRRLDRHVGGRSGSGERHDAAGHHRGQPKPHRIARSFGDHRARRLAVWRPPSVWTGRTGGRSGHFRCAPESGSKIGAMARTDRPVSANALKTCRLYGAKLIIAKIDRLSRGSAHPCRRCCPLARPFVRPRQRECWPREPARCRRPRVGGPAWSR